MQPKEWYQGVLRFKEKTNIIRLKFKKKLAGIAYFCVMSNFLKLPVLLFALVLCLAGTSKDNYRKLLDAPFKGILDNHSSSYAEDQLNILFCLLPSGENITSSGNHLPPSGAKNNSNDFSSGSFSLELKIRNIALQYLLNSREIYRALTIGDIIFPFHYFW